MKQPEKYQKMYNYKYDLKIRIGKPIEATSDLFFSQKLILPVDKFQITEKKSHNLTSKNLVKIHLGFFDYNIRAF